MNGIHRQIAATIARLLTISKRAFVVYGFGVPVLLFAFIAAEPLVNHFYVFIFVTPVLFVVWLVAAVRAAFTSAIAVRAGAWRSALGFATLPLAVVVFVTHLDDTSHLLDDLGDYANLAVMRPSYDRKVMDPTVKRPRIVMFERSGVLFGSAVRGIVFDETDEIALPTSRRDRTWNARTADMYLNCDDAKPLWAHYFVSWAFCEVATVEKKRR